MKGLSIAVFCVIWGGWMSVSLAEDTRLVEVSRSESPEMGGLKFEMSEVGIGEKFILQIRKGEESRQIDETWKPIFYVNFSPGNRYFLVTRPMGFVTMVDMFEMADHLSKIRMIFSSSDVNKQPYVDYVFQKWDLKKHRVIFDVYENLRYKHERKSPRLLSREYIYLDGKTEYEHSEGDRAQSSSQTP